MARGFNGSTFTLGSAVGKVIGITRRVNGATIDVTEPDDANKLFEVGQADLEVTIRFAGVCSLDVGDTGSASIGWADGTTRTLTGTWIVTSVEESGQRDGAIESSATIKPTVAST